MENEKELQQFKNRIAELSEKSYQHGIYTYTGFLTLAQQDVILKMSSKLAGNDWQLFGGNDECERKILRFGTLQSLGYEEEYPILCLCIKPLAEKFADELGHRDYLGAVLNLGIDRSAIGDIFLKDKRAYLFCTKKIALFLQENLIKIRHTNVKCQEADSNLELAVSEPKRQGFTVSSPRIDGVGAKVFRISRTGCQELFKSGKVYINARQCENSSYMLKEGDVVTFRGYGKFIYYGCDHETKKGRLSITVGVYGG